jgi:hypothetical protein
MTGTDLTPFAALDGRAQFFRIAEGRAIAIDQTQGHSV